MVDALAWADKELLPKIEAALVRLLPRLQATDAHLLNAAQRERLNSRLIQNLRLDPDHRELIVAILKAWEQVGDESALEIVRAIADSPVWTKQYSHEEREAARHCLPFLEQSIERQRYSQSLLRASQASDPAPDTLLRPAAAGTLETEPQQLLRASGPGTENVPD